MHLDRTTVGMEVALRLGLALACALLAGLLATLYPANRLLLAGAALAMATLCASRPRFWLVLVPAMLPVLDLTPWTGSLYVEEFDVLLLAGLAGAYAGLGAMPVRCSVGRTGAMGLGLFAASVAIAAVRGAMPLPEWDVNAIASYYSGYNALRVAKGFGWALLALPFLAAMDASDLRRWLVPGMLVGLSGCAASVMLERWLFPGLLDFASDYRAVGLFSAMHVGGAALDGYLALALPFALVPLASAASALPVAISLAVLAAGGYAVMASFSRGLYAGVAIGAAVFATLRLRLAKRAPSDSAGWLRAALSAASLVLAAPAVFGAGGYRGLAAYAAGGWMCWVAAGADLPLRAWFAALAAGLGTALALTGLGSVLPKGPYVVAGLALAVAAGALIVGRRRGGVATATVTAGAAFALALLAAGISIHWGGESARGAALLGLAATVAVGVLNLRPASGAGDFKARALPASVAVVAALITVPVLGNYRMTQRFDEAQRDLGLRLEHWRSVLGAMDRGALSQSLGMGLGRFPEVFLWTQAGRTVPGLVRFEESEGNVALRLSGPRAEWGGAELLRYGQRIADTGSHGYHVHLRARNAGPPVSVSIEICNKWLLYAEHCAGRALRIESGGTWRDYESHLTRGASPSNISRLLRPLLFAIAVPAAGSSVEVDEIRVIDAEARELIENGGFERGSAAWFFTSDRHHLPYHEKNLGLHVFFAQGWLGIAAFGVWLVVAGRRVWRAVGRGDSLAPALAGALCAFLAVGMFDSLLDFPRIAFLFFLLLIVATLRPIASHPGRA